MRYVIGAVLLMLCVVARGQAPPATPDTPPAQVQQGGFGGGGFGFGGGFGTGPGTPSAIIVQNATGKISLCAQMGGPAAAPGVGVRIVALADSSAPALGFVGTPVKWLVQGLQAQEAQVTGSGVYCGKLVSFELDIWTKAPLDATAKLILRKGSTEVRRWELKLDQAGGPIMLQPAM